MAARDALFMEGEVCHANEHRQTADGLCSANGLRQIGGMCLNIVMKKAAGYSAAFFDNKKFFKGKVQKTS